MTAASFTLPRPTRRTLLLSGGAGAAVALLSACGSGASGGAGTGPTVITSAYPIAHLVQKIGGERVERVDLASPGADPHALELSVAQVAQIEKADLIITIPGFQNAIDDAVDKHNPDGRLSAFDIVEPLPASGTHEHEHGGEHAEHEDEHGHEDHAHEEGSDGGGEHAHEHEDAHAGHDHGPNDPHLWHDPMRMAEMGDAIAERLAKIDADNAEAYRDGAKAARAELEQLDADLTEAFSVASDQRAFVTSHTAFAYLADRYDLEQIGIAGIDPEVEPSPQRLLELERIIQDKGITTVFFESTASPEVAESLAENVGVKTEELDNLSTQLDEGLDYPAVMRANAEKITNSWA